MSQSMVSCTRNHTFPSPAGPRPPPASRPPLGRPWAVPGLISRLKTQKLAILGTEKPKGAILGSEKAPAGAHTHTPYFLCIEKLYRGSILRREEPSGKALGLGSRRWPVRFPVRASHFFWTCWEGVFVDFYICWDMSGTFFRHFLVGSGSFFREIWDVLGCVWEWSGEVFGWVWEGLGKNVRGGRKIEIFKNVREYFP